MTAMRLRRLCLAILALGLLVPGCSEKSKTIKVSGKVYGPDGNAGLPVAAEIIFQPTEGGGRAATGIIYDDGSFHLGTSEPEDGALPGKYKVVIRLVDFVDRENNPAKVHAKLVDMTGMKSVQRKKRPDVIHPNYLDPGKTPLSQEVPTSGEVEIHLNKDGT
jgi:hypothetical protein